MRYEEVLKRIESLSSPDSVEKMRRFGITPGKALGVSIPEIRRIAKQAGADHALAKKLWESGIHECRILASMIDTPKDVTGTQLDQWVADFDTWDVCDQCCNNLFRKTASAWEKIPEWCGSEPEFVRRAGFVMMAVLAVHDKKATDEKFHALFPLIEKGATDERNFVKKAVNWALRQIGKRNTTLNERAVGIANTIRKIDSASARWIASDALRELTDDKVRRRLKP